MSVTLDGETGALLEITAVATEADFGKSAASLGKMVGGLIDQRQAEKAKDDDLTRLQREQAVLEARVAIKAANDALTKD